MTAPVPGSPVRTFLEQLADAGPRAHEELDQILDAMSVTDHTLLLHDWKGFWARAKQLPPLGRWSSWGFLTGRGFGKTKAIAEYVTEEAMSGRAMRIALMAQDEKKTHEVMVFGQSGLIETSPPWFKARMFDGRVIWPNGAQAFLYWPSKPASIRGPEHQLAWLSEFIAWPRLTMDESLKMIRLGLRLGYGRMVWDSTPKRRHPLIRYMLQRAERRPDRHIIVRGTMRENEGNLAAGVVDDLYEEMGGTRQGREELDGEYFDDDDGALWDQDWIDVTRRDAPDVLKRRIIVVDPAISDRKGTDQTGISDQGLGYDDQVYIFGDHTTRYRWEEWGKLVVKMYMSNKCDCVIVERNRGGDAVAANIRAAAKDRDLQIVIVEKDAPTTHTSQVIYVKEVNARRTKAIRAEPVATEYEAGRVSHVNGADLANLEELLTTWEPIPGEKSPDGMDALVHGVFELADLANRRVDLEIGFKGLTEVAAELESRQETRKGRQTLASILGTSEWGETI